MMISVHLPKTAGVSFRTSLTEHFGSRLLLDYADGPINKSPTQRHQQVLQAALDNIERDLSQVACIHGHFLPLKYLSAASRHQARFITWMRDPIERLVSHYHYWLQTYQPATAMALHRRVVEEGWTLDRFCLSEEMRNTYAQFLWGFPLAYFEFIGITEHYSEDLAYFSQAFLGGAQALQAKQINVGTRKAKSDPLDAGLRREAEAWHAQDVQIYQRALILRQQRLANAREVTA